MYLTAAELRRRALEHLGQPTGGVTPSIPVIVGKESFKVATFLFLTEINPRAHVVYPPQGLVYQDPTSGKVLSAKKISPSEIGPEADVEQPLPRHPDERRLDADEQKLYWEKHERLFATFHEVWWAYTQGQVRFTPQVRERIVDSANLFYEVAERRVLPWYEGLAGPFLSWMRGVRDRSKQP
jgi:hypothetical protein